MPACCRSLCCLANAAIVIIDRIPLLLRCRQSSIPCQFSVCMIELMRLHAPVVQGEFCRALTHSAAGSQRDVLVWVMFSACTCSSWLIYCLRCAGELHQCARNEHAGGRCGRGQGHQEGVHRHEPREGQRHQVPHRPLSGRRWRPGSRCHHPGHPHRLAAPNPEPGAPLPTCRSPGWQVQCQASCDAQHATPLA